MRGGHFNMQGGRIKMQGGPPYFAALANTLAYLQSTHVLQVTNLTAVCTKAKASTCCSVALSQCHGAMTWSKFVAPKAMLCLYEGCLVG